jgi:hypothetical protein
MKINVLISQTLSANAQVEVPENYTKYDLKKAVVEQIQIPSDDFEDWELDDFEVVVED